MWKLVLMEAMGFGWVERLSAEFETITEAKLFADVFYDINRWTWASQTIDNEQYLDYEDGNFIYEITRL